MEAEDPLEQPSAATEHNARAMGLAEIVTTLGGLTDLQPVLDLIARRTCAMLGARAAGILLLDGDHFIPAAAVGDVEGITIRPYPNFEGPLATAALRAGRLQRFEAAGPGGRAALLMPMLHHGRAVGVLAVVDHREPGMPFPPAHEPLLAACAASAAIAVVTARSASDAALRRSIDLMERERAVWARELHDGTLQQLAAVRLLVSGARRSGEIVGGEAILEEAERMLGDVIRALRARITDLRPPSLDMGLEPALEAAVQRVRDRSDLDVTLEWDVPPDGSRPEREIEATVHRVVQEALENIIRHAGAHRVHVRVSDGDEWLRIEVHDDGRGLVDAGPTVGSGVLALRERVALLGGTLELHSVPGGGTRLLAAIPAPPRETARGSEGPLLS